MSSRYTKVSLVFSCYLFSFFLAFLLVSFYVVFFILQISWKTTMWLVTTIPCGFCMPMEWTLTTRPSHIFWLAHPPLRWHEETWPYPMTAGKTWWNGAFVKSRRGRRSQCSDASYEYVIKSNYRGQRNSFKKAWDERNHRTIWFLNLLSIL